MNLEQLKNTTNIAILGYGKEGKSTLNFLLKLGIPESEITILDKNYISTEYINIKIVSGENYLDNLGKFNLIFKSPGISPYNPKILPYRNKLTSQTEVFFDNYSGKTIGITATKGKSTVSSLLYETLKNADYNVKLVGNIGNPVFDEINLMHGEDFDYVIYELSSYMLETCEPKCNIAILGNIFTCHLGWHNDSFKVYEQAKLNILKQSDTKVISQEFYQYGQNIDNVKYFGLQSEYSFDLNFFKKGDKNLFSSKDLFLLGDHNKKNICSVIAVIDIIAKNNSENHESIFMKLISVLEGTLKNFKGLPHRMEVVGFNSNITFIDDGISTTPESTIEAIKTFGGKINTLFLGGGDYGFTKESYDLLKIAIKTYEIKNIVLFPDTGLDIFNINRESKSNNSVFSCNISDFQVNILYTHEMKEAVNFAYKFTGENNICLMSCAAPSYSLWTGYEQKGQEFKNYIDFFKQ